MNTLTRGERVRVNFDTLDWPNNTVFPHGHTGTIIEAFDKFAILALDDSKYQPLVKWQYLEAIPDERTNQHA